MMTLSNTQQRLLWWSIGLSALGYLGFALWSGWREVWQAFQHIGVMPMLAALALSLMNYLLRAERWHLYLLRDQHPISRWTNLRIYFAGFSLTTTPGKAGELIRSLFLKPYGVQFHHSAAMFFSERLADLVAIVALTAIGFTHLPGGAAYFALLVGALMVGLLLLRTRWPERLLRQLAHWRNDSPGLIWLSDVAASSRPFWRGRLLWQVQGLTLLAWLGEGVGAYLILHSLQADISLSFALFVYGFAMLVGALSFLPGGLGGTEATMTGLLVLQGMPLPQAIAATVIIRLATLWFAVLLGVISVMALPTPDSTEIKA
ncbi:MAG: lysylphosphatidylglycerol synthase transmembrane domain-containing protein [Pseudomonadota bacterium]